ncbi:hypothetical protein A3D03_05885 [Candidatus Gottesmanbacteria bacterium RIFCSPHIGHO2_02_FULL_40_13]|uniref:Fibronectin type-III domain-containing protein n=1 Tax=Candidatus Gottesmanbacteria bacterium RIFCSPHIGHO2_02_FULL_40_13 TaxID=1798384 RepID=A0A1F6AC37_9BACT|nr:MAG: hypothetical protein A3D03_05885 [Candidatus Gottesmanbacteria bacterium RIFCSPHIGHO2_02_FULL_40_13]
MKKISSYLRIFLLILFLTSLSAFTPKKIIAANGGLTPPAPQKVWAKSGPMTGEVTIYWSEASYANRYAAAYGTASNKYLYGADNIGNESSRSYVVKGLTPGMRYYFRIAGAHNRSSSPFSAEFSGVAMGASKKAAVVSPKIVSKTPQTVLQKTSTPIEMQPAKVSGKYDLWSKSGPKDGEVTLYWKQAENADNYHIVYGTMMGNYQYGVLNVGATNHYTIGKLVPGKTYYFALVPVMHNQAQYTTAGVAGRAKSSVTMVVTTKEALIQPAQPIRVPVVSQEDTLKKPNTATTSSPTVAPVTEDIPAGQ